MDYTFKPTASGAIETSQGGKIVSTGTADNAALNYGYVAPAPATPPVQQTTSALRTLANTNSSKLDTTLSTLGTNAAITKSAIQNNPQKDNASSSSGGMTVDDKTARQLFGNDFTGLTQNADGTYTADSSALGRIQNGGNSNDGQRNDINTKLSSDTATANSAAQSQIDNVSTTLDGISGKIDTSTDALIDSIKSTYNSSMALLQQSNQKVLNGKTQSGIRSGIARYASGVNDSVISDEEQQGVMRINDLNSKMLTAIAQAEQARNSQKLDVFNKKMADINTIQDNLRTEVQNLNANATAGLKAINDKITSDMAAQKQQTAEQLVTSDNIAHDLSVQLATYTDPSDQAEFINQISKQTGIPADVLLGSIHRVGNTDAKAKLDLDNIQSQIEDRAKDTAIAQQNANTASENANNKNTVMSGSLKYTSQMQGEDSHELEASRREDGYVDPNVYKTLYQQWVNYGGVLKDFLKQYPPENYVDPDNTDLPSFLMPKAGAGGSLY